MSSTHRQIKTFRYSGAFQALPTAISTNQRTVLRASALICADVVGRDLSTVLPNLRQTLGADLPLDIPIAVQQIYQRAAQTASSSLNLQEADQRSNEQALH